LVALLFSAVTLPASVSTALRTSSRLVVLRSSTSGALTHCMRCSCWLRRQRSASGWLVRSRCGRFGDPRRKVRGARSSVLASAFGNGAGVSFPPGSFAPNKSFKPTPCRGFVETSRHAGNTGSHPPRSARLNSGVRAHLRNVYCQYFSNFSYSAAMRMHGRTN
jgi:predicted nucleic acid-binding Zn ribbon protein